MESIIVAIIGSSAVTGIISYLVGRKREKNKDAESSIELSEKVRELIDDRVKKAEQLGRAETAQHAAEFEAKLLSKQLDTANATLERVWIEIGKAEEKERTCSERLTALEVRVTALTELETVNQKQASIILQLRAQIDEMNEQQPTVHSDDSR